MLLNILVLVIYYYVVVYVLSFCSIFFIFFLPLWTFSLFASYWMLILLCSILRRSCLFYSNIWIRDWRFNNIFVWIKLLLFCSFIPPRTLPHLFFVLKLYSSISMGQYWKIWGVVCAHDGSLISMQFFFTMRVLKRTKCILGNFNQIVIWEWILCIWEIIMPVDCIVDYMHTYRMNGFCSLFGQGWFPIRKFKSACLVL